MAFGILCFALAVAVVINPYWNPQAMLYNDPITVVLLAILGFVLLIAPLAKYPWSAIFGMLGGVIAAIAIAFLLPDSVVAILPFSLKWLLIIVFVIVGLIIFIAFKWIEDLTKAFAMLLASRPVTLILMIIGIIQAIALLILPPHGLWTFVP
jgi:hypothetical protein